MGSGWSYHMVVRVPAQRSTHRIHKLYLITWPHLCLSPRLLPHRLKIAQPFYPELTLDHQTSLSSPTNTGPWFVSSTHVDPRVLHTHIWDHQVPCAKYLDSLHADGTTIYSVRKERERERGKNLCRAAKKDQVCTCTACFHVENRGCMYYNKGQSGLKLPARKDSLLRVYSSCAISGPATGQGCSFHSEVCDSIIVMSYDEAARTTDTRVRTRGRSAGLWLLCERRN